MNILFVCTGNTCRSPMAEHLFRRMLTEHSRVDVKVLSAGTAASSWIEFPSEARRALEAEHVVDVKHAAQNVSDKLIDWADLILTMEAHHKRVVVQLFPAAANKTHVLNAYADLGDDSSGVRDPYGGSFEMYIAALAQIKRALQKILSKI